MPSVSDRVTVRVAESAMSAEPQEYSEFRHAPR